MKISLITLHRIYNYGSVLQAYASQVVLEQQGYEVEIVDYITQQRTLKRIFFSTPSNLRMSIPQLVVYRFLKFFSVALKELTFGRFVRTKLKLSKKYITIDDLLKNPPKADFYMTGSDQTWNSTYNEGIDRGFFLDFVPENAKRISFVSSFGKSVLEDYEICKTKELLSRYSALSVREDAAVDILSSLGLAGVQLIDPTLQITKDVWKSIASKRLVKEPYLVLMLLYNEDNGATEYARKIADQKGLTLVKISWELKKPPLVDKLFTHRSPEDFLSLFSEAEFIVTNSFHGTAFAINFEKQFLVIPRNEYNSRITSLLKLCGLKNRLVSSEESAIKECESVIDYEKVRLILDEERQRVFEFLDSALKV